MRVYLARHGETTWNLAGRYQGRRESALTALGVRQGMALGTAFAPPHGTAITRIVASPLWRCQATARFVADRVDLPLTLDDGYTVDAVPLGALLITRHNDVPGMIGKVGTILGAAEINISTMQVSRDNARGNAMMVLATDRAVPDATREAIRAIDGIASVRALHL